MARTDVRGYEINDIDLINHLVQRIFDDAFDAFAALFVIRRSLQLQSQKDIQPSVLFGNNWRSLALYCPVEYPRTGVSPRNCQNQ